MEMVGVFGVAGEGVLSNYDERKESMAESEDDKQVEVVSKFISLVLSVIKRGGAAGISIIALVIVALAIVIIVTIVRVTSNESHSNLSLAVNISNQPDPVGGKGAQSTDATPPSPPRPIVANPPTEKSRGGTPPIQPPWTLAPPPIVDGASGQWKLFGENAVLINRSSGRGLFVKPSEIEEAIGDLPQVSECAGIGVALETDAQFQSWLQAAPDLADAEIGFWVGTPSVLVGCRRDPELKVWAPRIGVDQSVVRQENNLLLRHKR